MARFSSFLLALWAIHPAVSRNVLEEGQTQALQLGSVEKGSMSESPAHGVRLRLRQSRQCVDPGYLPCADVGGCCPPSRSCCPTGCCPKGTSCCPGGGCAFPGGKCCGGGWSCRAGSDCFPGVQSICVTSTRNCPSATTVTSTVTKSSRRGRTTTTTITQTPDQEEEMPDFSCPPMTVTNGSGDVLKLGDDCALELAPATTTSNGVVNRAAAQPLAVPCPAQSTSTTTTTTTKVSSYAATRTTTKTVAETAPPDFSCAPMTATNSLGDELAMDEGCAMEFSPGSKTQNLETQIQKTDNPYLPPTITREGPPPTKTGGAGRSIRGSYPIVLSLAALAVALA